MRDETAIYYATKHRLETRAMQTLLGICSGICADDKIFEKEVLYLKTWLCDNRAVAEHWPGSTIVKRIDNILADSIITYEELEDLLELLRGVTQNHFSETGAAAPESPALPIDDDPSIYFSNMSYCFTGKFFFGTRAACERTILGLGGIAIDNVSGKLDYLVIGGLIQPAWIHTTYGRKIESAMKHKASGSELAIISEQQWTQAIADAARDRLYLPG